MIVAALILLLLMAGPAAGIWLYSTVERHYRNTDKSHGFEHETAVAAQPVTGSSHKVDAVKGTKDKRVEGDNAGEHRKRL